MTTTINASTSSGLVNTADTSGILQLQTASTAALTIDASQNSTFAGSVKTNTLTSAAATALTLQSAGTTAITVDTSQNVGIGTASPSVKLDVSGSVRFGATSSNRILYLGQSSPADNGAGSLEFQVSNTVKNWAIRTNNNVAGALEFCPSTAAGGTTYTTPSMLINSSGNVGIGTTSPLARLNVSDSADGAQSGTIRLGDNGTYYGENLFRYNSSEYRIGVYPSGNMTFYATGSENMRLSSAGNLLVGTTTAGNSSIFTAQQSGANINTGYFRSTNASTPIGVTIEYSAGAPNNTGQIFLNCGDNAAGRFQVRSNGGLANYSANNVNLSDQREKKDIALAQNYLDKICQIPVKTFLFNDQTDTDLNLGAIAQDVQAVCPELVMESNWAGENQPEKMRLSIYQTDLQYALMKSIQELKAINDTQAETINALTARIVALEQA